jgi:hypothetical protein
MAVRNTIDEVRPCCFCDGDFFWFSSWGDVQDKTVLGSEKFYRFLIKRVLFHDCLVSHFLLRMF